MFQGENNLTYLVSDISRCVWNKAAEFAILSEMIFLLNVSLWVVVATGEL